MKASDIVYLIVERDIKTPKAANTHMHSVCAVFALAN